MDKQEWQDNCQAFELDFHQKENYRWNKDLFTKAWHRHFNDWCGYDSLSYFNMVVLDLGCGSAPAIDYFTNAVKFYLDPLMDDYLAIPEIVSYWDKEHILHTISHPAEVSIPHLYNSCSFINCWNVLDHCYDWRQVMANIRTYARPGCLVSLGTDMNPHTGHAGIDDTKELFRMINESFDIVKEEPGYWKRDIALLLRKKV